jgi:hypothetical protein
MFAAQALHCLPQIKALVATGLNPESPADYVGVYLGQATGAPILYESRGTLCGGATAVEGCQTAAANVSMQTMGFLPLGSASATSGATRSYAFVLITRADTVTAITDEAGLRAFLGPIDTPNEAMLRLFLSDFAPVCTNMIETAEGYVLSYQTGMGCGVMDLRVSMLVRRDTTVSVTEGMVLTPCLGRRPEGLRGLEPAAEQPELGRYFAEVARLEAAAVRAFDVMLEELQRFGAPEELVLRARHARSDEMRHAWAFEELAESRGTGRLPVKSSLPETERCSRSRWRTRSKASFERRGELSRQPGKRGTLPMTPSGACSRASPRTKRSMPSFRTRSTAGSRLDSTTVSALWSTTPNDARSWSYVKSCGRRSPTRTS